MSNVPTTYGRRRGKMNKSSMTVRLALSSMKFDAIEEWVKAYRELEHLSTDDIATRLEISKVKLQAMMKLFEHMFPKIKEIDKETADMVEMEQIEAMQSTTIALPIEEQTDKELIETLNGKPND